MRRLYEKETYNEFAKRILSLEENDKKAKCLKPIENPIKVGNIKVFIADDLIYSFDKLYLNVEHLPKTLEVEFDVWEDHGNNVASMVMFCFFVVRLYKLRKIHLFGDYGYICNNLYNPYNNVDGYYDNNYNVINQLNSINRFLLRNI